MTFGKLLIYYIRFVVYKFLCLIESNNYRLETFVNGLLFPIYALNKFNNFDPSFSSRKIVKNIFGSFLIRWYPMDIEIASTSYERQDFNFLRDSITKSISGNNTVLFLDIGAGFGKYSVALGNIFKHTGKKFTIMAFEPEMESFKLLKENIQLNNLKKICLLFNVALSNQSKDREFYIYPNMKMVVSFKTEIKRIIQTKKLDDYIKSAQLNKRTHVYVKLDVEGHELKVLEGGKKFWDLSNNTVILTEDTFDSQRLRSYLLKSFNQVKKI